MFLKRLAKALIISLVTVLAINLSASLLWAQAVVSLEPKEKDVLPNQDFALNVFIKDVSNFAGYQFNLQYDPGLFLCNTINKGDFLSSSGSPLGTMFFPPSIDNTTGKVSNVLEVILGNYSVSGSGLLATLNFKALATPGIGDIYIPESSLKLADRNANYIPFTLTNARISVTPEPISSALFLVGGAALVSRRLFRKKNKA